MRRLRLGGRFDELERISREHEDRMAEETREIEDADARAAEADRRAEIQNAALHALRAVEHLRTALRGERDEAMKSLDHHARRMRTLLDLLRK